MGLKLTFLSWWTPNFIINQQFDNVSSSTTNALTSLLKIYSPNTYIALGSQEKKLTGSLGGKRAAMAKQHRELVAALVEAVGEEQAAKLGREKLFEVGKGLGTEIRGRLGITSNSKDLVKAAKLLYRVLGIDFDVEWHGQTNASLLVHKCALAKEYNEVTCSILSATDEGVINGLQPKANMTFKNKITDGTSMCIAEIKFS
jgi:predicted ArsR family transcriptional regulator